MAQQSRQSKQIKSNKQFQKLTTSLDQLNRNIKAGKSVSKSTMKSTAQGINSFSGTPSFAPLLQQFSEITRSLGSIAGSLGDVNTSAKAATGNLHNTTNKFVKEFELKLTSSFDKALKGMSKAVEGPHFKKFNKTVGDSITKSMKGVLEGSLEKDIAGINAQGLSTKLDKKFQQIQSKTRGFNFLSNQIKESVNAADKAIAKSKGAKFLIEQAKTQQVVQSKVSKELKSQLNAEDKLLSTSKKKMLAANDYYSIQKKTLDLAKRGVIKAGKHAQAINKVRHIAKGFGLGTSSPIGFKKIEDIMLAFKGTKAVLSNPKEKQKTKGGAGDCCEEMVAGLKEIVSTISIVGQHLSNDLDRIANILLGSSGKKGKQLANQFNGVSGRGGTIASKLPPPIPGSGVTPPPIPAAGGAGGGGGIFGSITSLLSKTGPIGMAIAAIGALVVGTLYEAFKMTLGIVLDMNEAFKQMAKDTGTSVLTGEKLVWNSMRLLKSEKTRYLTLKEVQAAQIAMIKSTGTLQTLNQKGGEDLAIRLSETGKFFGYGVEAAAEMHQQFRAMGADDKLSVMMQRNLGIMSEMMGIPVEDMMKDMADSAEYMSTFLSGMPDHLMKSVVEVRKLGFSMKQVASMTDKVTNLSGFMEGAVESLALGGPNLSKVFYKALTGNPADMVNELVNAIGGSKGWTKMEAWTKKVVANTVGLTVDEISRATLMNERMANMGEAERKKFEQYKDIFTTQELADDSSIKKAIASKEIAASVQRMWDNIKNTFVQKFYPMFQKMTAFFNSKAVTTFVDKLMQVSGALGSGGKTLADWAMKAALAITKGVLVAVAAVEDWFNNSSLGKILSGKSSILKETLRNSIPGVSTVMDGIDTLRGKKSNKVDAVKNSELYKALTGFGEDWDKFSASYKPDQSGAVGDMQQGAADAANAAGADQHARGSTFIKGPGTSKSDSVPARLSVGERVVPASINKKLGGISNDALPNLIKGYAEGTEAIGQDISTNKNLITAALAKRGILDKNMVNAILGNVGKESGFKSQEEDLAGYANTSLNRVRNIFGKRVAKYSDDALSQLTQKPQDFAEAIYGAQSGTSLGNVDQGDAWKYRGRGFVQLTGKANYEQAGSAINENLVSDPSKALVPRVAAEVTAWFMSKKMGKMASKLDLPGMNNLSLEQALLLASSTIAGGDVRNNSIGLENLNKSKNFAEALSVDNNPKNASIGHNGQLPLSSLSNLGTGANGQSILLNPMIASPFTNMARQANVDGVDLYSKVTDSYRDLARQEEMVRKYGLYSQGGRAAVPGTSNHGWGLAVDLAGEEIKSWMRENASKFGFSTIPREPWHWEYRRNGFKSEELESSLADNVLPKGVLAKQFAQGTEFVKGPGTSKSDSIAARLSNGERVVPTHINSQLGGIPNESLPFLADKNRPSFELAKSLGLLQSAGPSSLQYQADNGAPQVDDMNSTMVARSVEQSNVIVVSGLQAVVQRLDRIATLMEQEVGLSGQIARKPVGNTTIKAGGSKRQAGSISTPGYFEN